MSPTLQCLCSGAARAESDRLRFAPPPSDLCSVPALLGQIGDGGVGTPWG
jgi:hypothetical protein